MKYAIFIPADQTIVYYVGEDEDTCIHAEARLFDTREEAASVCEPLEAALRAHHKKMGFDFSDGAYPWFVIEEVPDVEEFKSRPDTW